VLDDILCFHRDLMNAIEQPRRNGMESSRRRTGTRRLRLSVERWRTNRKAASLI